MCQTSTFPMVIQIMREDKLGQVSLSRSLEGEEIKHAEVYFVNTVEEIPSGVAFKILATSVKDIAQFYGTYKEALR